MPVLGHPLVERERLENAERNVAVVGLRDSNDRILMIRTRRLPEWWQPLGGGMEPGEAPEGAALRELFEEAKLSLELHELEPVATESYDFGEGTVHFFQAHIDSERDSLKFNEQEILEHRWLAVNDAVRLDTFPATQAFLVRLSKA
ncbi:MAG: NUDIX hydrolase [Dactylosporangium sp.]|nr:NUDIX hydrolase [Dactylosporangium sp.]NNJ61886.1 NUDIX hydrolase [Dactylosporangium sp.]